MLQRSLKGEALFISLMSPGHSLIASRELWDTEIPRPPPNPTLQDQNVGTIGGIMSSNVGILEDIAREDGCSKC